MSSLVSYELNDAVATITMDDGKVNALSPAMQAEVNAALDQAAAGAAAGEVKAVVLAGSSKVFSGGFDLSVFSSGDVAATLGMLAGGFELAVRTLSFPVPVIMAATGHAIAMGSFLLLSGDHRVGSSTARCQANEVKIGMTLPIAAIEIMRMRLTPATFQRALSMAAVFTGEAAIAGGWVDEVVEADAVLARAQEVAAEAAATLNTGAHVASKLKARAGALTAIQAGIDGLAKEFAG